MNDKRDIDMPRFDKKGRQIFPGDVLKVFHFIDRKNRRQYMYKIAHELDGKLMAAHAHAVYKHGFSLKNSYWVCPLATKFDYEIIEGFDPVDFVDRPRKLQRESV